jgi:putative salt-induced outer membrane protein YdiY
MPLALVLASLLELMPAPDIAPEPVLRVAPDVSASPLPAEAPAAATGAEEGKPEPGPWAGSATLGLEWLTGNSRSLTVSAEGLAEYNSSRWVLTLKAVGTYVTAAESGEAEDEVGALVSGWARGERRFTPLFSGFLYVGSGSNHFASLELRLEGEAGVGVTVLERRPSAPDELLLRFYLGVHYSRDKRYQYYPTNQNVPDQNVWSPGVALTFRAALNDHVKFSEDVFVFPAPSRVLVRSNTKLTSSLTGRLALTAELVVESNSAPAPDKAKTDTMLLLGAMLEFH